MNKYSAVENSSKPNFFGLRGTVLGERDRNRLEKMVIAEPQGNSVPEKKHSPSLLRAFPIRQEVKDLNPREDFTLRGH